MGFRLTWLVATLLVALLLGCGEPRGGPRLETHAVTGTVIVDGTSAAGVLVACYPQGDGELKHRLTASTDEQGAFSLGTYESGDGLPQGEYKLTFEWMEGPMLGPGSDKLKGAYSDPEKSEFAVTVKDGEEHDLGEFQLSTK